MGTGTDADATVPAISVVIPAYNAGRTLGAQLEALSRQAMDEPWELIVADNGSTDDTALVANAWATRLPLRVVDASARRGPAAARNMGVAATRAPLLAFCDADDVVADDWLPKVFAALQTDAFIAIGVRLRAAYSSPAHPEYVVYSAYPSVYVPPLVACGAGHMAVRADLFRALGGFDESLLTAEDHDLCYRIQLEGHPLASHPQAIVTVHRRDRLIDVFRQQYRWGANDGAVRHKYERVRVVFARALADGGIALPSPDSVAVIPLDARIARSDRLRASVRSPTAMGELVARLWSRASIRPVERLAFRLGQFFTATDKSMPQVEAAIAEKYVTGQLSNSDDGAKTHEATD